MKFKYIFFLQRKLWKLDGEYSYRINENNSFRTQQGIYGSNGWSLGENERIIFTLSYSSLKIHYQKGKIIYQKTLDFPHTGEIIFEITEQDRINCC